MMAKNYEELGREADQAIRNTARARQTVMDMKSADAMAALVRIEISNATWDNGLLHLQPILTAIVRERIADLMVEAVQRMQADTKDKTDRLRLAFEERGDADLDEGRQVPRMAEERDVAPLMGRSRMAGYTTGFQAKDDEAEHAAAVARTPPAGSGPGAGPAAPSGPTSSLLPNGEGLGQVPMGHSAVPGAPDPSAVPTAAADPNPLSKGAMETLEWVQRNPRSTLAGNKDIQELLTRKLVAREGNGPKAVYAVTMAGEAHLTGHGQPAA